MLLLPGEYDDDDTPRWYRVPVCLLWIFGWVVLTGMTLWAVGALSFDLPFAWLRTPAACLYALGMVLVMVFARGGSRAMVICLAGFFAVLAWWLTIRPSNDRDWMTDVDRTAWAEIAGDSVTIHNFRNFDYRTETDYLPSWETRAVDLAKLRGVDLFVNYWGSPYMAHPIFSFDFGGEDRVCMSIETRKTKGQSYSAIGGLYRQFGLIYIAGAERDLVRVRTNYRKGEDLYLYHLRGNPAWARVMFLDYMRRMNRLHTKPEFYNALASNCTTNVRTQASYKQNPWDWRILLNGLADQMLYERGMLCGGLPFPELKRRALINQAAQAANASPDFSRLIREGRPGFDIRKTGTIQLHPQITQISADSEGGAEKAEMAIVEWFPLRPVGCL